MPGKQLWTNNANTTLSTGYGPADTSIIVVDGVPFPNPTSPDFFLATIETATSPKVQEIVKVTARSGATLTVTRAQENTTAKTWIAGDIVSLRETAGTFERLQTLNPDAMAFAASN